MCDMQTLCAMTDRRKQDFTVIELLQTSWATFKLLWDVFTYDTAETSDRLKQAKCDLVHQCLLCLLPVSNVAPISTTSAEGLISGAHLCVCSSLR